MHPYITEVAAALAEAGLTVNDTWTEPGIPVDHVIEIAGGADASLHLIWNERAGGSWVFIWYPRRTSNGRAWAPQLAGNAAAADVVDEARNTVTAMAEAGCP